MKIWHFSAMPLPESVSGVSNTAWQIALAQAALGHEITLFLDGPPSSAAIDTARGAGLGLRHVDAPLWQFGRRALGHAANLGLPDVVQMCSVFIPRQAALARALRAARIPYVIKPAGGLSPRSFRRHGIRKRVYSALIERRRFRGAAAVIALTEQEAREVGAFAAPASGIVRVVPNPVSFAALPVPPWAAQASAPRLAYMGRFDIHTKGIDLLVDLAARLPEFEFDLYGEQDPRWRRELPRLQRRATANVHFHRPIFGAQKVRVLAAARACILASRSEGFSRSIAEAMALGVPCVLPRWLAMAQTLRQHQLGVLFGADLDQAAGQLRAALQDLPELARMAARARAYADRHFAPRVAAEGYLSVYQEVLDAVRNDASSRHQGDLASRRVVPSSAGN